MSIEWCKITRMCKTILEQNNAQNDNNVIRYDSIFVKPGAFVRKIV